MRMRLIGLALLLGACDTADPTITLRLDQADLQTRLERAFPIDTTRARTRLVLENPEVMLPADSDRIGVALDFRIDPPLMDEIESRATVMGGLRYDPSEAALYLDEPEIAELQLGSLQPENAERLRSLTESVMRRALSVFPVYRLDRRTLGEFATEHVLRSVAVEDGRLLIELGLPRSTDSFDEPEAEGR